MRTPWRFVADLVSRKPKADLSESPASPQGEIKALEFHSGGDEPIQDIKAAPAEQTGPAEIELAAEPEANATTLVEPPEPSAEPADVAASDMAADTHLHPTAVTADQARALVTNDTTHAAAERQAPARKKSSVSVVPEIADRPGPAETTPRPEAPKTFVEEMAALDLEVAAMRRQLATKLDEQNAQLRKMLARFEKR